MNSNNKRPAGYLHQDPYPIPRSGGVPREVDEYGYEVLPPETDGKTERP